MTRNLGLAGVGWGIVAMLGACEAPDAGATSYYDREIAPIFQGSCVSQTTGCHTTLDGRTAAGNLVLTSYDDLMRRRDLLPVYGPYPVGGLLLKASEPQTVRVDVLDPPDPARPEERFVDVVTSIRHTGGTSVGLDSAAFAKLQRWIAEGFSRRGQPVEHVGVNEGPCSQGPGVAPGFDADVEPTDAASFAAFEATVAPVLRERCAGGSCHGAKLADLHLACGDTPEERRWNYFISVSHLAEPAVRSELLMRPLATSAGGSYHGGGDTFESDHDPGYMALRAWAEELVARAPELVRDDAITDGFRYFVNRVQPTLVRKGCMFLNCHSPISPVFELRGGSGGVFSRLARNVNYSLARKFLAYEAADPNQSRIVGKNLFAAAEGHAGAGIVHRGGALFEDFPAATAAHRAPTPADCAPYDADHGDLDAIPAYCVLARWHAIERASAIARGEIFAAGDEVRAVIWVDRPVGEGDLEDFEVYRPGADLVRAEADVGPDGALTLGAPQSLLAGCGLTATTADVRAPAVSWDGASIVFSARTSDAGRQVLYRAREDGTECHVLTEVDPGVSLRDGVTFHDFDPAFAPDGRLVFASTRGLRGDDGAWTPSRTPSSLAPNANLYVLDADGNVRPLTFLLNQEREPAFMHDGRVIYTAEKREPGFHQLALRRHNLDGGDYHPLYAQRGSLGFDAARSVSQHPNGDFVFVASTLGAREGAGRVAFANRSVGPDQAHLPADPRGFLHSLRFASAPASGVFRGPAVLPTGRVLASCVVDEADATRGGFEFGVCEIDFATGTVRALVPSTATRAKVDLAAVYARPQRGVFRSDGRGIDRPELVPDAADSVVHFNDFPMIASLMFANTREGRPIDRRIAGFDVLATEPPPVTATSFDALGGSVVNDEFGPLFVSRRELGHVPLFPDGSAKMRVRGGQPLVFRLTDAERRPLTFPDGAPMAGEMVQRESEQYYPGERIQRSIPRRFFNAACGACHGSLTGRELDVAVDVDIVSGASINEARDAEPVDLYR